jgi:5-oxoprolinase (ATP-hydrolysing)
LFSCTNVTVRFAGILSAFGLGLADLVVESQEPCSLQYSKENLPEILRRLDALVQKSKEGLLKEGFPEESIRVEVCVMFQIVL